MAHLKFRDIETDYTFYPEGVETVYTGIAEITHDGDGENIDIVELFINGEKQSKIFGTDKAWTKFLDTLCEATRRCNDKFHQERIILPVDSMWHKFYPAPSRLNFGRSGGNAFQVSLYEILNF